MYLFGRNHSGSFPTLPLHFSSLPHAGQLIKPLGGFFIMETRAMFALPSAYCQVKQFPPSQLHMYIVKKYLSVVRAPMQPVKGETFPPIRGKCVCLRPLRFIL